MLRRENLKKSFVMAARERDIKAILTQQETAVGDAYHPLDPSMLDSVVGRFMADSAISINSMHV